MWRLLTPFDNLKSPRYVSVWVSFVNAYISLAKNFAQILEELI